jgi:lipid-A-disaccharide synthase
VTRKIFLSAGELSGDALGARLMRALRAETDGPVTFAGIGGPAMQAEGLESLFDLSELAVMGLVEVIPHIPRLRRRIAETAAAAHAFKPDALVTIDAPGFNKRVAKALGPTAFPKIHYVAPSVWAWRPKRVHAFRALFDRLLCLLPFEPPYFEAVGLDARFVGHSILESGADAGDGPGFRAAHGLAPDVPLLCVLPGSRAGEVSRLLPIFGETLRRLSQRQPDLQAVIPAVQHLAAQIRSETAGWPVPVTVLDGAGAAGKYDAMAASNAALATSGTVALELALARVPSVIAYRVHPITYQIASRLVSVQYGNLVNILADRMLVPEHVQAACTPDRLAADALKLLQPAQGTAQTQAVSPYLDRLRPPGGEAPSTAAARVVLDAIRAG